MINWKSHPSLRTAYLAKVDHGLWQVFPPTHEGGQASLNYGPFVDMEGVRVPMPTEIGTFTSVHEALLAAEMLEENPTVSTPDEMAGEQGFAQPNNSDLRELTIEGSGNQFLLKVTKKHIALVCDGPSWQWAGHFPHRAHVAKRRPPHMTDPDGVETAILIEILKIRRSRDVGQEHVPVSSEEYEAWKTARYGQAPTVTL